MMRKNIADFVGKKITDIRIDKHGSTVIELDGKEEMFLTRAWVLFDNNRNYFDFVDTNG